MFTEDRYKKLFVDWELHAKDLLGRFRAALGQYIEDTWLAEFIDDLKKQSSEFNSWWALHQIESNSEKYKKSAHPIGGILYFEVSNFDVSDNSGLKLIVHTSADNDTSVSMRLLMNKT